MRLDPQLAIATANAAIAAGVGVVAGRAINAAGSKIAQAGVTNKPDVVSWVDESAAMHTRAQQYNEFNV